MSTPPGWYDDGSGTQRWWDGTRWAEQPPPPSPGRKQTGLVVGLVVALVALVAAVVVVLVLVLGGDDDDSGGDRDRDDAPPAAVGPPTDASESEFCDSMQTAGESILEQSEKDGDEEVDFGEAIRELEETGTPEDISDDAREGFESLITAMDDLDGKTVDEVSANDDEIDGDDAFNDYYTETCASF